MTPKYVDRPEMKIVGLGANFISVLSPDRNNMNVIPELWEQFVGQMGQIKGRSGHASYGLVEALPSGAVKSHEHEMFYIAGLEVMDFSDMPAGMIQRVIPAGRYAMFTHKGKLHGPNGLGKTMYFIYREWLPQSGLKLQDGPHIEVYDERFRPGQDESEFDVLLPLGPEAA